MERIRLDRGNFSSLSLILTENANKNSIAYHKVSEVLSILSSFCVESTKKSQRNCFRFLFSPFIELPCYSFVEKLLWILKADRVHETESSMTERRQNLSDFTMYFNLDEIASEYEESILHVERFTNWKGIACECDLESISNS
jgi:hypothetical protein